MAKAYLYLKNDQYDGFCVHGLVSDLYTLVQKANQHWLEDWCEDCPKAKILHGSITYLVTTEPLKNSDRPFEIDYKANVNYQMDIILGLLFDGYADSLDIPF